MVYDLVAPPRKPDLLIWLTACACLCQVNEAAEVIYDLVDPSANLIFGAVVDPRLGQEVSITLIATGFGTGTPVAAAGPGAERRAALAEPPQPERCAGLEPEQERST